MINKLTGYLAHAFTTLGSALGLWALFATADEQFQLGLWLLAAAAVIDSVDGALARKAQVTTRIPEFNGALLDNIIDYLTWTIVPLFWAWQVLSVPTLVLIICGMASAVGFSRIDAKTEDHFFKGFPNYWNLVVIHMSHVQSSLQSNGSKYWTSRLRALCIHSIGLDLSIPNPLLPKDNDRSGRHLWGSVVGDNRAISLYSGMVGMVSPDLSGNLFCGIALFEFQTQAFLEYQHVGQVENFRHSTKCKQNDTHWIWQDVRKRLCLESGMKI